MSRLRVYSIKAKFAIGFFMVVGIILCSGLLSISFSIRHLSSARLFAENIIPKIQKTNDLQQAASQVKGYSRELSHAVTKEGLTLVYSDLKMALTRMEELTATMSNHDSGIDIVSLNFMGQAIRNQAQLIFQIKAKLLETDWEIQVLINGIRQNLLKLGRIGYEQHLPDHQKHDLVHNLIESLLSLMGKLDTASETLSEVGQLRSDLTKIKTDYVLELSNEQSPNSENAQNLMGQIMEQIDQLFATKQQSLEITRRILGFVETLNTVNKRLDRLTKQYINDIRGVFRKNAAQILEKEKNNIYLTIVGLFLSIIMLYLFHRRIIVRGFGDRLSIISKAMGRGVAGTEDMPLPVEGQDEIADMAKAAEELLKKARKLNTYATIDELTQLYNRRHFFQLAKKEARRAARKKLPAIILMLDIDHFKRINDTWGHDFGDKVLYEFAKICSQVTREVDLLARWGGEEFVLLMPETELEQGKVAAGRLLETIAALELSTDSDQKVRLTVSIGVAQTELGTDNLQKSLRRADTALYNAKNLGRNRVEVFTETTPSHSGDTFKTG